MINKVVISWQKKGDHHPREKYLWPEKLPFSSNPERVEEFSDGLICRLTQRILKYALHIGLKRDQTWDLSQIKCEIDQKSAAFAASIYLRGVPTVGPSKRPLKRESGTYQIRFHALNLELSTFFAHKAQLGRTHIIADKALESVLTSNEAKVDLWVHASESNKIIATVNEICENLRQVDKENTTCLIFGGGIVCDLAAFAAELSGLDFQLYPSTLLAMVDASIGGKSGVNVAGYGKNLIGSFAFPTAVEIFPSILKSLPAQEFVSAGAECLKHSFLGCDPEFAGQVVAAISERDLESLAKLLPKLVAIKASIVNHDPYENGQRATLNFGHTIGHTLEAISNEQSTKAARISHGQAVAVGMAFALHLSLHRPESNANAIKQMQNLLHAAKILPKKHELNEYLGLKIDSMIAWQKVRTYLKNDKKNSARAGGLISMVLMEDWAKVIQTDGGSYTTQIPIEQLERVWKSFFGKVFP